MHAAENVDVNATVDMNAVKAPPVTPEAATVDSDGDEGDAADLKTNETEDVDIHLLQNIESQFSYLFSPPCRTAATTQAEPEEKCTISPSNLADTPLDSRSEMGQTVAQTKVDISNDDAHNHLTLEEIRQIECIDPTRCGDLPMSSDALVNDYDGFSNGVGDEFSFTCKLGKTGEEIFVNRFENLFLF